MFDPSPACHARGSRKGDSVLNPMIEMVEQYFEERHWHVERLPNKPVFRLGLEGEHGRYPCGAVIDEGRGFFIFHSLGPENAPEGRRPLVAELLARLNWAHNVGAFAMDFEDGQVRLRTSVDVSGDRLSRALVENVIRANLVVMDQSWPLIHAVMTADLSPEVASEALSAPRVVPLMPRPDVESEGRWLGAHGLTGLDPPPAREALDVFDATRYALAPIRWR